MRWLYEWYASVLPTAAYWFGVLCVAAICINIWAWLIYDVVRDHRRTFKKGSDEDSD